MGHGFACKTGGMEQDMTTNEYRTENQKHRTRHGSLFLGHVEVAMQFVFVTSRASGRQNPKTVASQFSCVALVSCRGSVVEGVWLLITPIYNPIIPI